MPPRIDIPANIAAVNDYLAHARERLPIAVWEYIDSGSADDVSLRRNLDAWSEIRLNTRVLTDVSQGGTHTSLLGRQLAHPIMIAPLAYQKLVHPDGEIASAMAAAAQDAVFVLSTLASCPMEDVKVACPGECWFQLYFQESREATLALVRRAELAGYGALVVTVDAPINGLRNRLQRVGFQMPAEITAVNLQGLPSAVVHAEPGAGASRVFQGLMRSAPTWKDIDWLRQASPLPLIIKGIMTPADARLAREHGADAVVVSNHGGRALDTVPATVDVLPAIAEALDGALPILLDGGIRRGADVFKALALGATAVMIGRPVLHALATAGPMGVAHAIRLLRDELELTMALTGCARIGDIGPDALWIQD